MKIAIIIPYIGKFNNYFSLFLSSCEMNPFIDFLFFTDDLTYSKNERSKNIRFIPSTFDSLKERAQSLFDFNIALNYPYKLCDFRPCYGLMFADYLEGYDYWGHCDTDMIFGDILSFLSEPMVNNYKRILRHGHLTLYHNDVVTNNVFKEYCDIKQKSYRDVFTDNNSFAFDEAGGSTLIWFANHAKELYDNLSIFRNPSCYVKSFKYQKHSEILPLRYFYFDKGKLYDCYLKKGKEVKEEILYVHLFHRKMSVKDNIDKTSFYIIPNEFLKFKKLSAFLRFRLCFKPLYFEFWFERIKVVIKRNFKKYGKK